MTTNLKRSHFDMQSLPNQVLLALFVSAELLHTYNSILYFQSVKSNTFWGIKTNYIVVSCPSQDGVYNLQRSAD